MNSTDGRPTDRQWKHMKTVTVDLLVSSRPPRRKIEWGTKKGAFGRFEELLAPIYVPDKAAGSSSGDAKAGDDGMARFEKHWDDASTQARSTAKWMATVLGAALAAAVGTAPLSGIQDKHIPESALWLAGCGLGLIGLTLFLVLRVLVPNVTSFGDIMEDPKFRSLQRQACRGGGVMLPIGIGSLSELGWRARIESLTLDKLAGQISSLGERHAERQTAEVTARLSALKDAQQIRGRWHVLLTDDINGWTTVGAYVAVKKAAGVARFWGLTAGMVGTALIVAALLQVQPMVRTSPVATYHLIKTPPSSTLDQAQAQLGAACVTFDAVVTAADTARRLVTLLVRPSDTCAGTSIEVPVANLGTGAAPKL